MGKSMISDKPAIEKRPVKDVDNITEFDPKDYALPLDLDEIIHVVDVKENEIRPEEHKMRAVIGPLSAKDEMKVGRQARTAAVVGTEGWRERYLVLYEEVSFCAKVKKLENIFVTKNDKVWEITDPKELYNTKDRRIAAICVDIQAAIQDIGAGSVPVKNSK